MEIGRSPCVGGSRESLEAVAADEQSGERLGGGHRGEPLDEPDLFAQLLYDVLDDVGVGRHAFHPMMGHVEPEQAIERADGVPAANARVTVPVPQELEEVVARLLPRGGEENASDAVLELGTLGGIR